MVVRGDQVDVDATGAHRIPQERTWPARLVEKGGRRRIDRRGIEKRLVRVRASVCRRKEKRTDPKEEKAR